MGFFDAVKSVIGIEDIDDDYEEEITQEAIEAEKARQRAAAPVQTPKASRATQEATPILQPDNSYEALAPVLSKGSQNKSYSMNGSGPFKMLVIEPRSFDECTKLVDNLKSRKPVIINLEKVETDLARKMFDFMSGATYALNGNVQRVTSNIFIFAPANVDIAAKINKDTVAEPAYTGGEAKSPWR